MTFVLLFFTVAVLQVLNNWPTEGYRCEVRSYTDVSAFPARLGFTEEAGGSDTSFPEESMKEQRCSLLHRQTKYTLTKPCCPHRN